MTSRRISVGSVLVALLWLFAAIGCGDDDGACGASGCPNGCCDLAGKCQPWSPTSCGLYGQGGEMCVPCASGQSCNAGVCGGSGNCHAQSCPGCCTADGRCSTGTSPLECGVHGMLCQSCGTGQQCQAGACSSFTCGPATCGSGCCDSRGECVAGTGEGACGVGGLPCQACQQGQACRDGQCQASVTCANCAGCCDASGNCIMTPSNAACGTGGVSCRTCATGQTCVAGSCTCDPATCSGCCDGGSCRSGTTPTACGINGGGCIACGANQSCVNGQCGGSGACSFDTCTTGCCSGDVCNVGGETDTQACGRAGAPCVSCAAGMLCQNGSCNDPNSCSTLSCPGCCLEGRCELGTGQDACGGGGQVCSKCSVYEYCSPTKSCAIKPDSRWKVIIDHVVIDSNEGYWIDIFDPPDVFVNFSSGGASGTSSTIHDVWTAAFGETLTTATGLALTSSVTIEVWDWDADWDGLILNCNTVFTSQQILSKQAIFAGCPSDPTHKTVKEIAFSFELVSL